MYDKESIMKLHDVYGVIDSQNFTIDPARLSSLHQKNITYAYVAVIDPEEAVETLDTEVTKLSWSSLKLDVKLANRRDTVFALVDQAISHLVLPNLLVGAYPGLMLVTGGYIE